MKLGHRGHHDALQVVRIQDPEQTAELTALGQRHAAVGPDLRQRQAGDLRYFPIHQRDQLAGADKIANRVAKGGGQQLLHQFALRTPQQLGLQCNLTLRLAYSLNH